MELLVVIIAGWLTYGLIHSLLASEHFQTRLFTWQPQLKPAYRLLYNIIAIITLLPLFYLLYTYRGPVIWSWPGQLQVVAHLLTAMAIGGFVWSLKYYDMSGFLGLQQWRDRRNSAPEAAVQLVISPLHRYVRHPWYSLGLVLVWTRNMDAATLASAGMITLYLIIGSRLEERRLITQFGESYREYLRRVPGLLPLPGHHLNGKEAERLMERSRAK